MSLKTILANPIIERAYKTAIETAAALFIANPVTTTSSLEKIAVTAGATFLSVLWNGVQTALATRKSNRLSALAEAIDYAVAARLCVPVRGDVPQSLQPTPTPVTPTSTI